MRKKSVTNLDPRFILLIDNALHECNPPDTPICPQKIRSPIQLFLSKIIYQDLCRQNVHATLTLLRKLDWTDPAVIRTLEKRFTKIWKVKYSNVALMAFLLAELNQWHQSFAVFVVDFTLEELQGGLEQNMFQHNQRRVSVCKYIAELYTYRLLSHSVIFDCLYLILRFGHQNGIPIPNHSNEFDSSTDYFRLRLCCTILDIVGPLFSKSKRLKLKLDSFLVFMQVMLTNFFKLVIFFFQK